MSNNKVNEAILRLCEVYRIRLGYKISRDSATGCITINGDDTNILYPSSNYELFRALYWLHHAPVEQKFYLEKKLKSFELGYHERGVCCV